MPTPTFLPTADWDMLRGRAELLRQLREFFHQLGFLEVETPMLSADTVIDRHLDPLEVILADDPRRPERGAKYYLQTSPEFAMKRLLAAGAGAIYQVTHAFRAGERGAYHNPEFTMVEWYRPGDDLEAGMQLLSDLAEVLLARGPALRLSYREAFQRYAAIDPFTADTAQLARLATQQQLAVPASFAATDHDAHLELLLTELVQPRLGIEQPTIVYDFPASQSALALVREEHPPVAERFELFVDAVELANGYHELLDPRELECRNRLSNQARVADGKAPLPEESRLLAAMRHGLPACSGTALGFDRAVMVALGAKSIEQVLPFPIDRA
jgi:elongation factor P--(R)-beta-lysine ligase